MKGKKLFSAFLVFAVLFAFVLSGCTDSSKEEPTKAEAASTTQEAPKAEPVTLKYFTYKMGNDQGKWPEIIEKFQSEYSNIKVEVDGVTDGYNDVIKARLAGGEGPDVFLGWVQDCAIYDRAGYVKDLTNESFAANLNDIPRKLVSVDGKIVGMPLDLAGVGLFANMDILSKYSITTPTNWSEFLEACKKLKAANVLPFVTGHKTGWTAGGFYLAASAEISHENPDIGVQIYEGKQKMSELLLPMLNKYKVIADSGYMNAKESLGMEFSEQTFTEFANGKAAFMLGGTWQVKQLKDTNKDMKFEFAPFPCQDSGTPMACIFPGSTIFVNKESKHGAEALKFVEFVTKDENLSVIDKQQSAFSTLKGGSGADDPEVTKYADAVKEGNMGYQIDIGMEGFSPWTDYTKGCQLLIIGKTTPEAVAESVDKALEKFKTAAKK